MNGLLHAFMRQRMSPSLTSVTFSVAIISITTTLSPFATAQRQQPSVQPPFVNSSAVSNSPVSLLEQAGQLMETGKPVEAFALLSAVEDELAGSPQYDYMLGLVAIDCGEFDDAVLALQRVVLVDPGSAAARMELGRAYYGLGDMALARREFEQLQALNPPPLAQRIITDYLERIRFAESAYESRSLAYIELEGGYNNNANGATSVNRFVQFQLDDDSRRTSSGLYGVAVGGSVSVPVAPRWSLQSAGRIALRNYPNAEVVDSQQLAVATHLQWKRGRSGARVGGIAQNVRLDGDANSRSYAFDASAWRPLSQTWLARASARFGVQKFNDSLDVRDVSQRFYGLSLLRQSPGKRQMQFEVSLIGGDEEGLTDNAAGERPFGRNIYGAQLASSLFITQQIRMFASTGWLHSFYDGPFLRDDGSSGGREDDQYVTSLAFVLLEIPYLPEWSLRNEVRYVENDSDISLYEYDSFQVLLTARREFE